MATKLEASVSPPRAAFYQTLWGRGLDNRPQNPQIEQTSGNPKNICGNLSHLWIAFRSLGSQ
jgi:hypothetical protein